MITQADADIVIIYEDPFTHLKPEGQAVLIKYLRELRPGIGQYLVHFLCDPLGKNVERIIVDDASQ
jgi:predicted ATPase